MCHVFIGYVSRALALTIHRFIDFVFMYSFGAHGACEKIGTNVSVYVVGLYTSLCDRDLLVLCLLCCNTRCVQSVAEVKL